MSATYHSLASGNLAQNWSSTGQITTNDDWSSVPSIVGYLGDDVTTLVAADPRTLTASGSGAVDVIANQTNPSTLTSGGVAEFDGIANPAVALQGSGTADAPSLIIRLDATNRQDIRVQFNVRDLDASADDAQQQLAVQYRVGGSGAWTNVTGGYIADATAANAATMVTAIDVTLPAAANNQAQVDVRIITTNATGSDEWIGIDDIDVSSVAFTGGADTTAPALLSSTPADNATNVVASADIVLTFDEPVALGSGNVTVTDGAGDVRVVTVGTSDPDGTVTVSGTQATIHLANPLASGKAYDVIVVAGAIKDKAGNDFAGIGQDALDFTVAVTAPTAAIYDIQGSGHASPLVGKIVATSGVVTAIDSNGFYIQDPTGDGNIATSDGIFVFTASAPSVTLGHLVKVTGTVSEFIASGSPPGSLSITQINSPSVSDQGVGPTVVATQLGGSAGRSPPTANLDDDGLTVFDPVKDGIDFYESLEGMLVKVKTPVAVSPTNSFGEIFTIVDNDDDATNGLNTNSLTARGGVNISGGASSFGNTNTVGGDFNPERIQIDDDSGILPGFVSPAVSVGAKLSDVTGVMSYSFGNYEVLPTTAYSVTAASTLAAEVTSVVGSASRLTIGNYNVENLDPGDGAARFAALAQQIVNNLKGPDILALQEVQDNNGATNDAVISASTTLQMLVDAINTASGGTVQYAFQDNPFIGDDLNGGEPGGNIRVAFLYRVDRGVDLIESSLRTIDANGAPTTAVGANGAAGHPFLISRPPLVADFTFNGQTVTVVNNHFSSKTGSGALMGTQPPLNGAETARAAQAQAVNTYVDSLLAANPFAKVVVSGDLNEFEFEEPMQVLSGKATYLSGQYTAGGVAVLDSMSDLLPPDQRYDYVFDGSSQSLDQMYVTHGARADAQYDIVHMNAEFANQLSDHDALVGGFDLSSRAGNDVIVGTPDADALSAGAGDDTVSAGASADLVDLGTGIDLLHDKLSDLNGDKIFGFGLDDTLRIDGSLIGRAGLTVTQAAGSATLSAGGSVFELKGDFSAGDFMTVARGTGANTHTIVSFEPFLPTLAEGVRVDAAKINGVANEPFLVGDGAARFTVEFKSAVSAFHNTLGSYKVAADGTISDVHVLFADTLNVAAAAHTIDLGVPADGARIAFFLIQNGATTYGNLPDNLSFVAPGTTTPADIDTGIPPVLRSATLGILSSVPIFHSIATLNPGDASQVLSGVAPGGLEMRIGFEDLANPAGDNDFQDVIIGIRVQESLAP